MSSGIKRMTFPCSVSLRHSRCSGLVVSYSEHRDPLEAFYYSPWLTLFMFTRNITSHTFFFCRLFWNFKVFLQYWLPRRGSLEVHFRSFRTPRSLKCTLISVEERFVFFLCWKDFQTWFSRLPSISSSRYPERTPSFVALNSYERRFRTIAPPRTPVVGAANDTCDTLNLDALWTMWGIRVASWYHILTKSDMSQPYYLRSSFRVVGKGQFVIFY